MDVSKFELQVSNISIDKVSTGSAYMCFENTNNKYVIMANQTL